MSEANRGDEVFVVSDRGKGVPGWALGFPSVRLLLRAGEVLKQAGLPVLVVPRRAADCGVLLLVRSDSVSLALSALSRCRIEPVEVRPYAISADAADG